MNNLNQFTSFFAQKVMPLVYDESLSYYEIINKLIVFINSLITDVNNLVENNNNLQAEYSEFLQTLENMNTELVKLKNGEYIKDNSITTKKLSQSVFTSFREFILTTLYNSAKFVTFGLNEDGYFFATIPSNWSQVVFSTDAEGRLILNV